MQLYSKNHQSDHDEDIEKEFQAMLDDARSAYVIPKQAFDNYRVKRGLREADGSGVTAGVTRIGNVHGYVMSEGDKCPDTGRLEYRGYEISTLVNNFVKEDRFGFEECAFLLFFGHLPTEQELVEFNDMLAAYRRLPPRFTEDIIMKAPSRSIMNKMASATLALYAYDDDPDNTSLENMLHQSMEIIARLPVIAAQSYAVYQNAFNDKSLNIHNPKDHLTTAENFLRVLRPDKSYTKEEARLLDLCLAVQKLQTDFCRICHGSGLFTGTVHGIHRDVADLNGRALHHSHQFTEFLIHRKTLPTDQ